MICSQFAIAAKVQSPRVKGATFPYDGKVKSSLEILHICGAGIQGAIVPLLWTVDKPLEYVPVKSDAMS